MKVLIAEDDANIRAGLAEILRDEGYETVLAENGHRALELYRREQPDFLCLDIMMPGINGFQVCEKIRLDYPMHELPVIFLTAKDVEQDVKRGFDVGANEFVGKPVSKYQLLPRIENCLQQARLFRQLREQIKWAAQNELMHAVD